MRHGTSLAGRVWGRSGNVKKKWRTGVNQDVIELFLLSALAPWCSVSEPVCLFKSRTKIDHDETTLQGRSLVHFVGWPTSPLRRQWRSTRHACLRRWAAVRQGKVNPLLGHLFCEKVAQRLHKLWMATIWYGDGQWPVVDPKKKLAQKFSRLASDVCGAQGRQEIDCKTSKTEAKTKKTTSTSTSLVAVIDDVTKVREQIDSSSCVNNGRK